MPDMFLSKHYKLQSRSRDKALVMTIPANVVQNFGLTKDSKLKMSYEHNRLIIDLKTADTPTHVEVMA
jgi:antitoxin component of MazEF toxin-antitoxin module